LISNYFVTGKGGKYPSLTTGSSVGMPEVITAQNFNRRITAEEALILATAGDGSKTEGFRKLLGHYIELHNIGFSHCMSLQEFLDTNTRIYGAKIN
jgi:hypothetical protein